MKIEQHRDEYIAADGEGKAKLLARVYGLQRHQLWQHKQSGKWIVSHAGIEAIASQESIGVEYDIVRCDPGFVVIKATPYLGEAGFQSTFGEASSDNTRMAYPVAMAEKRGFDRAVLKAVLGSVGGHGADFYGEDEADDFKAARHDAKAGNDAQPSERNNNDRPKIAKDDKVPAELIDFLSPLKVSATADAVDLAIDDLNTLHNRRAWGKGSEKAKVKAWLDARKAVLSAESKKECGTIYRTMLERMGYTSDVQPAGMDNATDQLLANWMIDICSERIIEVNRAA